MSDYNSLRRRTGDSSWQWLVMGVILGLGAALVVCVGGYALGALTFPVLDADTATPRVEIEPNQTDVALQATPTGMALEATDLSGDEVAMAATEEPLGAEVLNTEAPAPTATSAEATPLPTGNEGDEVADQPTTAPQDTAPPQNDNSNPTPLPNVTTEGESLAAEIQANANNSSEVQGTPVVGTPPSGTATQTVTFTNRPEVPAALQAIQSTTVTIPGGTFQMGTTRDEGLAAVDECTVYEATNCSAEMVQDSVPAHAVTVDTFDIETTEVSLAQYVAFLNFMGPGSHTDGCDGQVCAATKNEEPNSYIAFDGTTYSVDPPLFTSYPAIWVTWWGAESYCNALNGRLPTEAEWERAARGDAGNIYPWGFSFDLTYANSNRPRSETDGPEPVDSYPSGATATGLYNMAGNVAEWVQDWYQENYYTQLASDPAESVNPTGPLNGTEKGIRGGSWDTVPLFLRSVHRQSWPPGDPRAFIGFRCVFENPNGAAPIAAPTQQSGGATNNDSAAGGAPTLAPAATQRPTNTPGPTATLAPG
ncbi:SUMF1/EgtB/PvdO family nonheme iron enzyme [Aggregatilinea lenta]|uniref:SUMF1/EgtB/PvdO family nonheme iron enzyme n=1 Tax=Aggregatilinea lenta TaxID=913108 RepID=UPI000E5C0A82|nr:SUMF1/EgtB/PvdO family nonheme iron enzyme [Aggregatilinea lenta]